MKLTGEVESTTDKPKEVDQILDEQIETGLHEFERSNKGLFLSSFGAGLEIGFSILLMGTVFTLYHGAITESHLKTLLALCYPIGFIFVIIGRSELFTEHTALAILPVMDNKVSIKKLLMLWGIVYSGNLLGGYLFSIIIGFVGPQIGFLENDFFYYMAKKMVSYNWEVILMSGIIAGWMMGLLGWLVTSSQETISRIFVIVLVTFIIGLAGLHHCIIGSIEVFIGMLKNPEIQLADYLKFQSFSTIGNAIGGVIFVAALKYSHGRKTK